MIKKWDLASVCCKQIFVESDFVISGVVYMVLDNCYEKKCWVVI